MSVQSKQAIGGSTVLQIESGSVIHCRRLHRIKRAPPIRRGEDGCLLCNSPTMRLQSQESPSCGKSKARVQPKIEGSTRWESEWAGDKANKPFLWRVQSKEERLSILSQLLVVDGQAPIWAKESQNQNLAEDLHQHAARGPFPRPVDTCPPCLIWNCSLALAGALLHKQ